MPDDTGTALSRDEIRSVYDRFGIRQDDQGWYEDKALQVLLRYGGFAEARTVVEVGCGTGRFAEMLLRERLPATARYVGFDISPTMVDLARQRLASWRERAEIRLTEGNFDLPPADVVVATYVVDLMDDADRDGFLAAAHRALSGGGRLCLAALASHGSVNRVWALAYRFAPRLLGGCRPVDLAGHLPRQQWRILRDEFVSSYGLTSEAVIATPSG